MWNLPDQRQSDVLTNIASDFIGTVLERLYSANDIMQVIQTQIHTREKIGNSRTI